MAFSVLTPFPGLGDVVVGSSKGQPDVCDVCKPSLTLPAPTGSGNKGPDGGSVCFISPVMSIKEGITSVFSIGETDFFLQEKDMNNENTIWLKMQIR